ncbi:dihydrolipoyl dehydrogenase [Bacillus salitolerans]|uniref:Dihydrolipoyl dehydrogenase n=1 Tax=Bacillus salitolerans TaxID=1437434 RepID=A0ABW4LR97_9BACI
MVVGELAQERDVIIIGGGPGGYHAAIRAAQLGLQVTLVESNKLGGVCLNEGCIPSKVVATSAQKYKEASKYSAFGIEFTDISMNLTKLQAYKQQVIDQLRQGVEALCKANKVEVIKGNGYFLSEEKIGVECGHQFDVFKFRNAIIATGASFSQKIDKSPNIFSERTIYSLEEVPEHLVVFGSDYISIEVAFAYHSLGAKVSLCIEGDDFSFDSSINRELIRVCKKNKIKVYKNSKFIESEQNEQLVKITLQSGEERISLESTHCYRSSDVRANIDMLGLDRMNIRLSANREILVDKQCRTSIPNIFAVGDVTDGVKLAVRAIKQGKVAAEVIAGKSSEYDEVFIPDVIHAAPQIACVGLTEEEANLQYPKIKVSQFPLASNGYAGVVNQKEGFVKVIAEEESGLILGVHMMGQGAIELLSSGIIGLEMVAREEDFKLAYFPHPSMNESLLEAIEGLRGEAVHVPPSKQIEKQTV